MLSALDMLASCMPGVPLPLAGAGLFLLACLLCAAAALDLRRRIVPDQICAAIFACGLVLRLTGASQSGISALGDAALGALLGGGTLYAIAIASLLIAGRPALGGGDIKLMAACGIWLGVQNTALSLFLAFILGGVCAAIYLARKPNEGWIPFAPMICLSALISLIWGGRILSAYLGFLLG